MLPVCVYQYIFIRVKWYSTSRSPSSQDSIQTILQSLSLLIGEAHHPRTKQRLLVGYFLFVRLIMEDIATGLNGTSPYIIHSVICTLINLFPEMLTICCDILMEVIKKVYVVSPHVSWWIGLSTRESGMGMCSNFRNGTGNVQFSIFSLHFRNLASIFPTSSHPCSATPAPTWPRVMPQCRCCHSWSPTAEVRECGHIGPL